MNQALLFGLGAGAVVGAVALVRGWLRGNSPATVGGLFLLIGALVGGIIVLSWESAGNTQVLEIIELTLTLFGGVLLLLLVARLIGSKLRAALPILIGSTILAALTWHNARWGGDPIIYAVPVQVGFTAWAWWLLIRSRYSLAVAARRSPAWRQRRLAFWLLVAVSFANIASLVRLIFPDEQWLRPIVPWTLSALFFALLLTIVWMFLDRYTAGRSAPTGGGGPRLVQEAAAVTAEEGLFADLQLRMEDVAERMRVTPAELAAALAVSPYGGFPAFIQDLRLSQARTMLANPNEARTSIDAIALSCGFGSRSAFYEAFQRRFGTSPGTYREKTLSGC